MCSPQLKYSPTFRLYQVGSVGTFFFILLALSLTDISNVFYCLLFSAILTVLLMSRTSMGGYQNIWIILSRGKIIFNDS